MAVDWEKLILAYLHDPPDKAVSIRDHETRAAQYASDVLGMNVDKSRIHGDSRTEDILASIAERFPMPEAGPGGERAVGPDGEGRVLVKHPLSASEDRLPLHDGLDRAIRETLGEILPEGADKRQRYFLLWRFLRDRLARRHPETLRLPADTRSPDASIWQHLDITAGLSAALEDGEGGAFLSFQISPVQGFIAAARSLRDLWSGSYILAWLTFSAMKIVIEELGPTAILFPNLRGAPLLDYWLKTEFKLDDDGLNLPDETLRMPNLPNRFLAVVPYGAGGATAKEIALRCEQAARDTWNTIAQAVKATLNREWKFLAEYPDWSKRWESQVDQYFDVVATVLGIRDCDDEKLARWIGGGSFETVFPEVQAVRNLAKAIPAAERPGYAKDPETNPAPVGHWQAMVDMAGRVQAARRGVRGVPNLDHDGGPIPPKCSLFGSYEQMGPEILGESNRFWEKVGKADSISGVRVRPGERFSAIALTKRFAWPACFAVQLGAERAFRYPDTATVAAAEWLDQAGINPEECWDRYGYWSGQWLHWPRPDFKEEGEDSIPGEIWDLIKKGREKLGDPPSYLAVLMLDGDQMGRWLQGKKSPSVRDVLHPETLEYFEKLKDAGPGLAARRPVGPALHAAISEALTNYSLFVAPSIVEKHKGTLVYTGGDDVLALLPTQSAVACARELNLAFQGHPDVNNGAPEGYYRLDDRDLLMMGTTASASAGLAVVHFKEDLRYALDQARSAERAAKNAGRNALALQVCKRSGEHAGSVMGWDFATTFTRWVEAFLAGSTDRWSYTLRQELPALSVDWAMLEAETVRLLNRAKDSLHGDVLQPDNFIGAMEKYRSSATMQAFRRKEQKKMQALCRKEQKKGKDPELIEAEVMKFFITLVQSASFLARGRDR